MSLMNPRLYQMKHGIYYIEFNRRLRMSLNTRDYEEAENKYKRLREKYVMELAYKIINSPVEVKKFINHQNINEAGYVYFLQSLSSGLIKIGFSASHWIEDRIKSLRFSNGDETELLKKTPGTMQRERKIHKKFAAYRKHGEWFEPSPELLNYIATVRESK